MGANPTHKVLRGDTVLQTLKVWTIAFLTGFSALVLILVLLLLSPKPALAKTASDNGPHILFIVDAETEDDARWYQALARHSRSSARALGVDLEILFSGTARPVALGRLETRLKQSPKPDYLVFGNQRGLAEKFLQIAGTHDIEAFMSIAPLEPVVFDRLGGPRGQHKHWIGQLMPDDEQAGYDLAMNLIEEARRRQMLRSETGRLQLVGITGRRSSTVSRLRHEGLLRAVRECDDVELLQVLPGRWQRHVTERKYRLLQQRYGRIDIVWTANDPMAIGVLDAIADDQHPPVLGGMDWIKPALDALSTNRMVASMGGQDFDIAYVIALLNHYHKGSDFADVAGTASLTSKLVPLTSANVEEYILFQTLEDEDRLNIQSGFDGLLEERGALQNITRRRFIDRAKATVDPSHIVSSRAAP